MKNTLTCASVQKQNEVNEYVERETGKPSRIALLNEKIAQAKAVDNWFKNTNASGDNFPQGYPSWL